MMGDSLRKAMGKNKAKYDADKAHEAEHGAAAAPGTPGKGDAAPADSKGGDLAYGAPVVEAPAAVVRMV